MTSSSYFRSVLPILTGGKYQIVFYSKCCRNAFRFTSLKYFSLVWRKRLKIWSLIVSLKYLYNRTSLQSPDLCVGFPTEFCSERLTRNESKANFVISRKKLPISRNFMFHVSVKFAKRNGTKRNDTEMGFFDETSETSRKCDILTWKLTSVQRPNQLSCYMFKILKKKVDAPIIFVFSYIFYWRDLKIMSGRSPIVGWRGA